MNTQFANGLMQLIPGFCGTFPCDMIPRPKPFTSFIVNTDTSAFGGEHWVAVYIARRNFYFFDSFGRTIGQFPDPFKSYMKPGLQRILMLEQVVDFYNLTRAIHVAFGQCSSCIVNMQTIL